MSSEIRWHRWVTLGTAVAISVAVGCGEKSKPLAPYAGSPPMSHIVVEGNSYVPRITWVGGFVSVLGVNRGSRAVLDSTLIWLVHALDDQIRYPVSFGQVPAGAQDLTAQYGGLRADSLQEDETYTYWVLKGDVWGVVSTQPGKVLVTDAELAAGEVAVSRDSIFISAYSHAQKTQAIDLWVNVKGVASFGRLGVVSVRQPTTSNNPIVSWRVTQSGVADSLIAAIGLVNAQQYQAQGILWEVWSVDSTGGTVQYGKNNVIRSPLVLGQQIPGTRVFVEYPSSGLERNKDYYVWIANKDWDGQKRLRSTSGYAWATFKTW